MGARDTWASTPSTKAITLPSVGAILQTLSRSAIDGAEYDAALQARQAAPLY